MPPENQEDVPRAQTLADFLACTAIYPDGTPADCQTNLAQAIEDDVPSGWICADSTTGSNFNFQAWTDLQGQWGVQYWVNFPDYRTAGQANLTSDGRRETVYFRAETAGFIRFAGASQDAVTIQIGLDGFHVSGDPEILTTWHLELRVTEFRGVAWYVAAFTNQTHTYYFPSLWGADYNLEGRDFRLNSTYWHKGYEAQTLAQNGLTGALNCEAGPANLRPETR